MIVKAPTLTFSQVLQEAYKELTLTVLGRIKNLTKVDLCFTPDDSINEVSMLNPLGLGNLGERMCKVFDNMEMIPYMEEKDLIEAFREE